MEEASDLGVQRRITPAQLKKMQFGDWVYLAQGFKRRTEEKDGVMVEHLKPAKVFGEFQVQRIAGIQEDTLLNLYARFGGEITGGDLRTETRGCGAYVVGASLVVDAKIPELVEVIEVLEPGAKLFVWGPFREVEPFYLADYPFARGAFIPINGERLDLRVRNAGREEEHPVITGRFDLQERYGEGEEGEHEVVSFEEYQKAALRS